MSLGQCQIFSLDPAEFRWYWRNTTNGRRVSLSLDPKLVIRPCYFDGHGCYWKLKPSGSAAISSKGGHSHRNENGCPELAIRSTNSFRHQKSSCCETEPSVSFYHFHCGWPPLMNKKPLEITRYKLGNGLQYFSSCPNSLAALNWTFLKLERHFFFKEGKPVSELLKFVNPKYTQLSA